MDAIANKVIEDLKIVGRRNSTYILGDDRMTVNKKELAELINMKVIPCLPPEDLRPFVSDKKAAITILIKAIENILRTKARENIPDAVSTDVVNSVGINYNNFIPLLDVRTDKTLMYNVQTKDVSELCHEVWIKNVSREIREEYAAKPAIVTYDPYDLSTFSPITFEGVGEVIKVNTYKPPAWRLKPLTSEELENLECPKIIWDFLTHLFPNEESLDFVLNWMYYAMLYRCDTYLVLNGVKGAGKNTFGRILQALVGANNFKLAPVSILDSNFNAVLKNNRIIFFDEIRADSKEKIDRLKKYANEEQTIELKGLDADSTIKTYNSCVIANNDLSSMFFKWDERRFSVPEITKIPMDKAYTKEEIDDLNKRIEEDEELHRIFGHWILYYGKDDRWDNFSTLKTKRFWDIVHNSLLLWEQFVVEKIMSRSSACYPINDLRREYKSANDSSSKMPLDTQKLKKLIQNYRVEGKFELGRISGNGKEAEIIPSEHFLPDMDGVEEVSNAEEMLDI